MDLPTDFTRKTDCKRMCIHSPSFYMLKSYSCEGPRERVPRLHKYASVPFDQSEFGTIAFKGNGHHGAKPSQLIACQLPLPKPIERTTYPRQR